MKGGKLVYRCYDTAALPGGKCGALNPVIINKDKENTPGRGQPPANVTSMDLLLRDSQERTHTKTLQQQTREGKHSHTHTHTIILASMHLCEQQPFQATTWNQLQLPCTSSRTHRHTQHAQQRRLTSEMNQAWKFTHQASD